MGCRGCEALPCSFPVACSVARSPSVGGLKGRQRHRRQHTAASYDRRLKYARFLAPFKPYTPKGLANLHDPTALADHADYLRIPTRAAAELRRVTRALERTLPRVDVPVLVIQSRLDRVVPPENGGDLRSHRDFRQAPGMAGARRPRRHQG
jgi:pimeloyl-ACP methyl ester carboxylesterase